MKYYLIAGEASGDLHASRLMHSLKEIDREADFRFFGGDLMTQEGGFRVRHYRDTAFMGFVPVLLHLPTILRNISLCKQDITEWHPDVVILIDYPGFNLGIAKYVKARLGIPVHYYIAPKIWAWKEYRIKQIKRDVSQLFSILPFEKDFFEGKHGYPIHYVGNPTVEEVDDFLKKRRLSTTDFSADTDPEKVFGRTEEPSLPNSTALPVIALLAGSRRHEIKDNLPAMIQAAQSFKNYRLIVAGAPGIEPDFYDAFVKNTSVEVVYNRTYELLSNSTAALVTSGTATLETALFGVPQVVCYKTILPKLISYLRKRILKVKYISLVNLIADAPVVQELVAADFSVENIRQELARILPEGSSRKTMLRGYEQVRKALGENHAADHAARIMYDLLHKE
ncbi:MAG: lipid-A-disaccharide synthase [Prevotella sp.]|nr:lipid-A-disaccharide synthase [Prevotella sp.]